MASSNFWDETAAAGSPAPSAEGPDPADEPRSVPWLLVIACVAVVVSAALLPIDSKVTHALGWAAGSLLAFTLVALFRRASVRTQFETGVVASVRTQAAALGVLALGFVLAVVHAWLLARAL